MFLPKLLRLAGLLVVIASLGGGFYLVNRAEADAPLQSTDDAYVQADLTVISPQVAGRVAEVHVEDNQQVQPGNLLVVLDDRDLRVALDSARAQVMSARATIAGLEAQIARQASAMEQAQATVAADDAALTLAHADRVRFQNLARDGSGTVQALQQAEAESRIKEATRQRDKAGFTAVGQQTDILRADLDRARAGLAQAEAAQAAAELNLSYARITAPLVGVVTQRSVRVGAYVTVGRPLLTLVPLASVYIEANFRETQLPGSGPGRQCPSRSTPCRASPWRAGSTASARPAAPPSRPSRRTTRPATSPRSCSACRSRSALIPASPTPGGCLSACR